MCSLFNKCGVRAWSRERWCLKKMCIVDSGKDINLIFLIMLILSLSSFSRHRRPYGIILIFLPCWRDVTGSWLLKMEMSWLASNYCVKKKKKKKEGNKSFWREVSACQLTEIQLKVCRDLSEYGPYPSQLSENHHFPARTYLTL